MARFAIAIKQTIPKPRRKSKRRSQQSELVQDPKLPGLSSENKIAGQDGSSKEWVISIKEEMEQVRKDCATTSWDKLCIYRVPLHLQENGKKSYFPQTVSIGPYHHDKKHLLPMEHHKWRAVNMIMARTGHDIEIYIEAMKNLEKKALACYQGPIDEKYIQGNEFIKMLVLDGCFVLELFKGSIQGFHEIGYAHNDPVFAMRGLMHLIQNDMLMLENQLPMFVLDRLAELQLSLPNDTISVGKIAVTFFDLLLPSRVVLTKPIQLERTTLLKECVLKSRGNKVDLHCLDVFRRSLLGDSQTLNSTSTQDMSSRTGSEQYPTSQDSVNLVDKRKQHLVHCVTELREAGVKFKTRETHLFWDIRFEQGCVEIPKLLIHDGTKSLFSNLIAFEQCHIDSTNDITSYIIFMDNLINSSEDVSHLHYSGIIEHWLGSDAEVADLFNQLCREVIFDPKDSYLSQLSVELNSYYKRRWNALKATLKHKYFNNPWAYFSFFAAVVLLILTLCQSFYAVYAYYKPPP